MKRGQAKGLVELAQELVPSSPWPLVEVALVGDEGEDGNEAGSSRVEVPGENENPKGPASPQEDFQVGDLTQTGVEVRMGTPLKTDRLLHLSQTESH